MRCHWSCSTHGFSVLTSSTTWSVAPARNCSDLAPSVSANAPFFSGKRWLSAHHFSWAHRALWSLDRISTVCATCHAYPSVDWQVCSFHHGIEESFCHRSHLSDRDLWWCFSHHLCVGRCGCCSLNQTFGLTNSVCCLGLSLSAISPWFASFLSTFWALSQVRLDSIRDWFGHVSSIHYLEAGLVRCHVNCFWPTVMDSTWFARRLAYVYHLKAWKCSHNVHGHQMQVFLYQRKEYLQPLHGQTLH